MTEYLKVDGGTLAYEVSGDGPLIVLVHGMGDSRAAYRFVTAPLVAAGYRVAALDMRGCGESSVGWASYTRGDIAGDMLALVRHLGGPAVLVGNSVSGGAATIAAAREPELVTALVELAPFTRKQSLRLGDFRVARYRQGGLRLVGTSLFGSVGLWKKYLDVAYPGPRPADWDARLAEIDTLMREPGRMKAMQKMGTGSMDEAHEQLANVTCPVLVVEGSLDPDWVSPRAEGEAIVASLRPGLGRLEMIEGAGHYPHTQFPSQVVALMLSFLEDPRA